MHDNVVGDCLSKQVASQTRSSEVNPPEHPCVCYFSYRRRETGKRSRTRPNVRGNGKRGVVSEFLRQYICRGSAHGGVTRGVLRVRRSACSEEMEPSFPARIGIITGRIA